MLDNALWDNSEVTLSLEKARVLAFLYIPADASVEEARGWLVGQLGLHNRLLVTTADLGFVCRVHAADETVRAWRVNGAIGDIKISMN